MQQNVRFEERQYFRQWWILLPVFGAALMLWWMFIQQIIFGEPVGTKPAPDGVVILLWLLFGIGFPVFWLLLHMDTIVTNQELIVRFMPFVNRHIPLSSIVNAEAREYNAIMEYGGWGIRWGRGGKRAYNVRGNRGIEITLTEGVPIMIGSQRPDELAVALYIQK